MLGTPREGSLSGTGSNLRGLNLLAWLEYSIQKTLALMYKLLVANSSENRLVLLHRLGRIELLASVLWNNNFGSGSWMLPVYLVLKYSSYWALTGGFATTDSAYLLQVWTKRGLLLTDPIERGLRVIEISILTEPANPPSQPQHQTWNCDEEQPLKPVFRETSFVDWSRRRRRRRRRPSFGAILFPPNFSFLASVVVSSKTACPPVSWPRTPPPPSIWISRIIAWDSSL